ncbi:hypothetical protein [Streptomyces sp. DH12]|uniref:hypothetical protein n=1 Tax=Streptomyces sp. DH12 TaxID=2857010 RepID=UPI001E3BF70C|nr:hypothetical protein [Streptomyces sp. DH12]
MSDEARRLYARIARQEPVGDGDKAVLEELAAWDLVAVDPAAPGTPVVLDPQQAARHRVDAGLQALAEAAEALARVPRMAAELSGEFERSKWWSGPASEFLAEVSLVNARIGQALGSAEVELLTAQPGGSRTREQVAAALEQDGGALARGVRIRSLYRDVVRDDVVTREYASVMSGRGAEFRTQIGPFPRMVIIDRREAFISEPLVEDAAPHAARHVRDRAMVAFIVEVFEEVWRRSEQWEGEGRPADGGGLGAGAPLRTTALQREILLDLENGVMQQATAARLGISLRRLTAEVQYLKSVWGAPSLPALAARWVRSPDRRLVDDVARTGP